MNAPLNRLHTEPAFRLLGQSPCMLALRERILRLAASDAPVAIVGESGSGKELAARDLHAHSRRAAHPFVAVNCGAIPEALMESEFFGHRRGAFTGAHEAHAGFFQAAHRGTLFLDEVAELPLAMQVKLLRAIQEGGVRKLGTTREEKVDVRIVSATHRDLALEVRAGRFRQDLYFRLQVIELQMPPLRERREDIPLLCESILARLARGRTPLCVSADAQRWLQACTFPGNVRELENVLERALAIDSDGEIGIADLQLAAPLSLAQSQQTAAGETAERRSALPALPLSLPEHLSMVERALICQALREGRYQRRRAAQLLGISLRQLRYRMQRLAIDDD
jgi:two-component system response regulator PilR (NtrC family)